LSNIQVAACHVAGCQASVFPELEPQGFCLEHYVGDAMKRLHSALADCRKGGAIERGDLEKLAQEARFAVNHLAGNETQEASANRERMIELVLGVANLNEHMRRSSMRETKEK